MILAGSLSSEFIEPLKTSVRVATQMTKNYFEQKKQKVKILFDMTTFTGEYSIGAFEIMVSFARETKPFVERTACFGGPTIGLAAGEMVTTLSGRDNIKFFKTKEEALAWLNEATPA